ncbi:SDR family oxidoreductase [Ovoidimarina sediminis]|uniref:SDR family oxidoreductase n=1 Tax=Ovoidimarina sediminis TaxID=3079856 RepID=UPI00290A300C|nr:SDR family oxidoreductase [Rhodophyticola sp. MJ-SS7]MDU8944657.1 SDR family oxidoreductase [Rhodophyticola sp. MJ-SS7]
MTEGVGDRRCAVVTGAASGIGQASARALRDGGLTVIGIDRNDPGDAADRWIKADLDDPGPMIAMPEMPVHVLVNAAGLPPRPGTEAQVLRVNFLALRRLTLQLLPRMPEGGSIVNLASKAGARWRENIEQVRRLMAQPDSARLDRFVTEESVDTVRSYDLSKEAVVAWTKAMTASLLDRDLRMNCISPAAIDTPILEDFTAAFGARATRGIELTRRSGRAEEVAAVVAFLADPASAWVRGCNIEADGGLTAQLETETIIGAVDAVTGAPGRG